MYCKNCGKENTADSRFCIYCGAHIAGKTSQQYVQDEKPVSNATAQNGAVAPKAKSNGVLWKVILIVAAILVAWTVFHKEKTESVSEQQIVDDIFQNNRALRETDMKITESEIISQEINDDLGMQMISVTYEAENAEATYLGEAVLYYTLENNSWLLSNFEHGETSYIARFDCDPSVPLAYLQNEYAQKDTTISLEEQVSWADNGCSFVYQVLGRENSVCSWTDSWTIDCVYDLWEGWKITAANGEKTHEVWNVCGTYVCNNENISATIELSEFQIDVPNNSFTATISYSLTSYADHDDLWGGPTMQKGTTYFSNEPATVRCSIGYDNEYVTVRIGDYVDLYICGREVSWTSIGKGVGLWVQVLGNYSKTYGEYWLQKQ